MFAQPTYLHTLWLLPVLIALRVLAVKRAGVTANLFVSRRLRDQLIASTSPLFAWFIFGLQLLAIAGFVLALAQPRWGEEKRTVTESGKNIIVAIDTSKSMMADDVKPNRLMRAKLAAQDLITTLREERVGLIAFAGTAYLQAPLTTDHDAVIESLQNFDVFTIPRGGSMISAAIREAVDAFEKTKARNHGLIVFSDGAEEDPELDSMLAKAKERHVVIVTVGVGTELGSLIRNPDPDSGPDDYIRDPATGVPVHTKLEEATLRKMAEATGGAFLRLNGQTVGTSLVMQTLNSLEAQETGSREESKPIERFYWPLGVGMFCLMLSLLLRPISKTLSAPALAALLVLLVSPVQAALLSNRQILEEAQRNFAEQNYARSRDLYAQLLADQPPPGRAEELAYGFGAAAEKMKDYDHAIDGFSRSLLSPSKDTQARAHHSLGNTLYEQGAKALQQQPEFTLRAWVDSVSHYESALAIRDDKDVRENMEFVKKHLTELQKTLGQSKDGKKKDKGDKSEKGQKGDKGDEEEEGEKGDEQKDGKQGDQKDKEGQQQDAQKGDKKDGQKQDGGDQKDGEKGEGEQAEAQKGEKIQEGQIQAGEPGEKKSDKELREMMERELAEEKPDETTGYSRNEARARLRELSDQMQLQFQRRTNDRSVKRDW